jgi:dCTP deaminase
VSVISPGGAAESQPHPSSAAPCMFSQAPGRGEPAGDRVGEPGFSAAFPNPKPRFANTVAPGLKTTHAAPLAPGSKTRPGLPSDAPPGLESTHAAPLAPGSRTRPGLPSDAPPGLPRAIRIACEIDPHNGYELAPRTFILGFTQQRIRLPTRSRIVARVEGRSSLARLGVGVHVTAPTIHAGFGARNAASTGAPIQLEIFNLGEWTVVLDVGMPICQLIFEEVREMPQVGYRGQFSEQRAFTAPPQHPTP